MAIRFLISEIDNATGSASPQEMESIDAFNSHLEVNGHWIIACGLGAPETCSVIDNRNDSNVITHGPLIDSPEHVSGFWLIDAASTEIAINLANQGSKACNRKVELRPLLR